MTTENPDGPMLTAVWNRLYDTIREVRDASDRITTDADSGEIASAVVPIVSAAMAAELRRFAAALETGCDEYIRDGASEVRRVQATERKSTAALLRARAGELDGGA